MFSGSFSLFSDLSERLEASSALFPGPPCHQVLAKQESACVGWASIQTCEPLRSVLPNSCLILRGKRS